MIEKGTPPACNQCSTSPSACRCSPSGSRSGLCPGKTVKLHRTRADHWFQSAPSGSLSLGVNALASVVVLTPGDTTRPLPPTITTNMPLAVVACNRVGSQLSTGGDTWIAVMYLDKPVVLSIG